MTGGTRWHPGPRRGGPEVRGARDRRFPGTGSGKFGPPHAGRLPKRGFTLLELMAAVGIIAVLVAAALPVYRVVAAEYRLAGAAADLAAALQYAQRLAVEQRGRRAGDGDRRFGVTVEPSRFLLREYEGGTPPDPPLQETSFPSGIEAAAFNDEPVPADGVTVLFDCRGLPDKSGALVLRDRYDRTARVEISAAGKVSVE